MNTRAEPVVFPNATGQRLFGMLHRPAVNRAGGAAVLLLSPGIKGRIAPHRLYIKLARQLCDAGFMVLRFDFYGLGDAEGELEEKRVADVYATVAMGRYTDDTLAAMNWMQHEYHVDRFVLSGLCGGAITGLFAGARDPRVQALAGFGIPVIQYGDETLRYKHLSSGEQGQFRRGYLQKLLDWKSWLRLLTLRSDFGIIAKVFLSPLKRLWMKSVGGGTPPSGQDQPQSAVSVDNLNPFFPPAFFDFLNGSRKLFLVFGGNDRLYWDYMEKFYQPRKLKIDQLGNFLEQRVIEGARHIYEEKEHHETLLRVVVDWVQRELDGGSARTAQTGLTADKA
jgi:uncharacterized protein